MKLVSKEIGTSCASVSIVDCEEWAARPVFDLFKLWLDDVQNNWNSILIIISHNALMSVCSITWYYSILFACELCGMVRWNVPIDLFLLHSHILLLLLNSHNEPTVGGQLIFTFWLSHLGLLATQSFAFWFFNFWVVWTSGRLRFTLALWCCATSRLRNLISSGLLRHSGLLTALRLVSDATAGPKFVYSAVWGLMLLLLIRALISKFVYLRNSIILGIRILLDKLLLLFMQNRFGTLTLVRFLTVVIILSRLVIALQHVFGFALLNAHVSGFLNLRWSRLLNFQLWLLNGVLVIIFTNFVWNSPLILLLATIRICL